MRLSSNGRYLAATVENGPDDTVVVTDLNAIPPKELWSESLAYSDANLLFSSDSTKLACSLYAPPGFGEDRAPLDSVVTYDISRSVGNNRNVRGLAVGAHLLVSSDESIAVEDLFSGTTVKKFPISLPENWTSLGLSSDLKVIAVGNLRNAAILLNDEPPNVDRMSVEDLYAYAWRKIAFQPEAAAVKEDTEVKRVPIELEPPPPPPTVGRRSK
jgi:hypothetical protein